MSEEKKLTVRLQVAGKIIPLSIFPSQEQAIREAAKRLNEQYSIFWGQGGQDEFKSFIMAALQVTVPFIDSELNDESDLIKINLQKMNQKVEEYISVAEQS